MSSLLAALSVVVTLVVFGPAFESIILVRAQTCAGTLTNTAGNWVMLSDADGSANTLYAGAFTCDWALTCLPGQFAGIVQVVSGTATTFGASSTLTYYRQDGTAMRAHGAGTLTASTRTLFSTNNYIRGVFVSGGTSGRGFTTTFNCYTARCSSNLSSYSFASLPATVATDTNGATASRQLGAQEDCAYSFTCPVGQFVRIAPTAAFVAATIAASAGAGIAFSITNASGGAVYNTTGTGGLANYYGAMSGTEVGIAKLQSGLLAAATNMYGGNGFSLTASCYPQQCSTANPGPFTSGGIVVRTDTDGLGTTGRPSYNEACNFQFACGTGQFVHLKAIGNPTPANYYMKDSGGTVVLTANAAITDSTSVHSYTFASNQASIEFRSLGSGNPVSGMDYTFNCYVSQCSAMNATLLSAPVTLTSDADGNGASFHYSSNELCYTTVACPTGYMLRFSGLTYSFGAGDTLVLRNGAGGIINSYSGAGSITTAFSTSNLGIIDWQTNAVATPTSGNGWTVTATCHISSCAADPSINVAYAYRPKSLRILNTYGLQGSTIKCYPPRVAAGNITWCRATIRTTCGTPMGDDLDIDILTLSVCPTNTTSGSAETVVMKNATFIRYGTFEFGFRPTVAGYNRVSLLIGPRLCTTLTTWLYVSPNVIDFRKTTTSCSTVNDRDDSTSQLCKVFYKDFYNNNVSTCQSLHKADADNSNPVEQCTVLSP